MYFGNADQQAGAVTCRASPKCEPARSFGRPALHLETTTRSSCPLANLLYALQACLRSFFESVDDLSFLRRMLGTTGDVGKVEFSKIFAYHAVGATHRKTLLYHPDQIDLSPPYDTIDLPVLSRQPARVPSSAHRSAIAGARHPSD